MRYGSIVLSRVPPDLRSKVFWHYVVSLLALLPGFFFISARFGRSGIIGYTLMVQGLSVLSWYLSARQNWQSFRQKSRWLD